MITHVKGTKTAAARLCQFKVHALKQEFDSRMQARRTLCCRGMGSDASDASGCLHGRRPLEHLQQDATASDEFSHEGRHSCGWCGFQGKPL